MCQHSKFIFNKYINKRILVSCGKCEACQQQKANLRATRIRNHNVNSSLCLFITLTYSNKFVPYVKTQNLFIDKRLHLQSIDIPVWRDFYFRYYRNHKITKFNLTQIGSFKSSDIVPYAYDVPQLVKKPGCTGIIYWPDLQNFIKRLRTNLKRDLGYKEYISYYGVGEYGNHDGRGTFRPHFHLLVYFPKASFTTIRPVVVKSWPFGDMSKSSKRIQVALDASSYLASYINKSSGFPAILQSPAFRQKHSHSFHFGVGSDCFSLSSLLSKVESGDFCYRRQYVKDGVPLLASLPIPEYVISRFFPKFKGYSSFTSDEILQLLRFPVYLWNRLGYSRVGLILPELSYSVDDYRRFVIHLRHCVDYYIEVTGKTVFDYSIDYLRVWSARFCYIFKHSFDDIKCVADFGEFYENANEFVAGFVRALTLPRSGTIFYQCNPNKRKSVVCNDAKLSEQFLRKMQTRNINAIVLSSIDDEF